MALKADHKSVDFFLVEAVFLEAQITRDEGHYGVMLFYKYGFEGNTYIFQQPARSGTGNESILFLSSAQEKVKVLTEKRESIQIYVDTRNPSNARTETGVNPFTILMIVFGGVFFLLGLRLLIFH